MTGNTDLPIPEPPVQISTGTDLAADRSQEIILEQLHQVMGMLERTRIPVRMAQALDELKEQAAFELKCDSALERSAVASVGGPAGQFFAAAAMISNEIPVPGVAPDGAQPGGTVMCSTAEAAAASESRRIDDESAGKDGGSGAMAPPESAQEARVEALRFDLPRGVKQ